MERLLLLHAEAGGCAATVLLNGMPLVSLGVAGGSACLAVHEYTLTGRNQLSVVVFPGPPGVTPAPQPRVAIGATWVRARLVLVRQGHSVADPDARVLASVEWAAPEGKSYEAPSTHEREVELPVSFPRWRWLDAPPLAPSAALHRQVLEFVQEQAIELARGNADPFVAAARLRFEELALAYQTGAPEAIQRFRDQLQQRYAAKALKIVPPNAEDLLLRPVVDARLIECLSPLGGPVLRTQNDDPAVGNQSWPMRLAVVEGRIYVLR
jgi:hypothetical protein